MKTTANYGIAHTVHGIDLRQLTTEELERFAMDLRQEERAARIQGRSSIVRHNLGKIRNEWDRRQN